MATLPLRRSVTTDTSSFQSIVHGNFPEVLTVDGCAEVATDDVSLAQFAVARQERCLDADLQHQLLKLSMM